MLKKSRHISLVGVSNFRDLGGYVANDGRMIRWGRLYRSDALHHLTVDDLEVLRALGIATIIDLRSPAEVEYTGRGLLAGEPIRFVNATIANEPIGLGGHPAPSDDDLLQRYLGYVQNGGFFVRAIEEMLDANNYPIVVNCFFGKDRTGVLLGLLLSCIGIDQNTIIEDYRLSDDQMPLIIERLRRDSTYGATIDRTHPALLTANAATMSRFLGAIDEQYGGARLWAKQAGVLPQQLDLLATRLLE